MLHGFPTSSHDFELALPMLARSRRVVLLDFPGFGLSGKPPPSSSSAPTLHDEIEGARLTWLESLGHYPMLEDPNAWSAAVVDFSSEHDEISCRDST